MNKSLTPNPTKQRFGLESIVVREFSRRRCCVLPLQWHHPHTSTFRPCEIIAGTFSNLTTSLSRSTSCCRDYKNTETGQRGFLLTNHNEYLDPYNSAVAAIPVGLEDIIRLTRTNPDEQARVAALKAHVSAKLEELNETITAFAVPKASTPRWRSSTPIGARRKWMRFAQLTAITREEAEQRAKRLAEMNDAYRRALPAVF